MDTDLLQPGSNLWQQMSDDTEGQDHFSPVIEEVVDRAGATLFSAYMKKIEALSDFVNTFKFSSSVLKEEGGTIPILGIIGRGNSQRFKFVERSDDSIMMLAHLKDSHSFTLSAYTDLDNLVPFGRVFRKYFGGGGHPKAAGFTVNVQWMTDLSACWDLMRELIKRNKDFDEISSSLNILLDGYPSKKAWMDMFKDIYLYNALFSDMDNNLFGFKEENIENISKLMITDMNLESFMRTVALVLFYELISEQFK